MKNLNGFSGPVFAGTPAALIPRFERGAWRANHFQERRFHSLRHAYLPASHSGQTSGLPFLTWSPGLKARPPTKIPTIIQKSHTMDELPKNIAAATAPIPLAGPERHTADNETTCDDALLRKAIEGLGKKVRGYVSSEVKTTYEMGPDGQECVKGRVVTRKHTPPDLPAIIFALTNMDGANWRAKPSGEGVAENGGQTSQPDLSALPEDVLRSLAEHMSAK